MLGNLDEGPEAHRPYGYVELLFFFSRWLIPVIPSSNLNASFLRGEFWSDTKNELRLL